MVSAEISVALATAVGIAMSLYRRAVTQERQRAREAEATRDAVASRRVAEDRLRNARELHDAVGHHAGPALALGVPHHVSHRLFRRALLPSRAGRDRAYLADEVQAGSWVVACRLKQSLRRCLAVVPRTRASARRLPDQSRCDLPATHRLDADLASAALGGTHAWALSSSHVGADS